jgi:hypothetical protein
MATSTLGSGTLVLAGTTSGTTTVTATAVAGTTTLTLPAATDTLVGKATTDTLTNKTLTGAVMNGTLGATTPSTVAATTLTTSSTVTHNGGTANGVAYLDGSKVLTTGSALTFDGATLTNNAAGTATALSLNSTNGTYGLDVALKYSGTNIGSIGSSKGIDSTGNLTDLGINSAANLDFATGYTRRMRLDSSGNLGLGVTPSAWGSGYRSLDIGNSASFLNSSGSAFVSNNAYQDGLGWKYKTSTANIGTQLFGLNPNGSGGYAWFQAPSGANVGDPINFTQAMTLTAGNSLLLNTTNNNNNEILQVAGKANILCAGFFANTTTGQSYGAYIAAGTNSTDYAFRIQNAAANTDYLKVTGDGNLLVGGTNPNPYEDTSGTGSTAIRPNRLFVSSNSDCGSFNRIGSNGQVFYFARSATNVGDISVTTTTTSYNSYSDYRLKDNIESMTGALAKVSALKPVIYKWKADGSDGQGFIAHELQAVIPDAVNGAKDAVDEDGKPIYQGVDTSFLVATLTAAIQEQQVLITTLTARITALESA